VTQYPEQQIARLFLIVAKKDDGFGERLVNGLVEADDVLQSKFIELKRIPPLEKDAGAEGTVFGLFGISVGCDILIFQYLAEFSRSSWSPTTSHSGKQ
jgi:hypothetical protein